jgi:hypothetical protein
MVMLQEIANHLPKQKDPLHKPSFHKHNKMNIVTSTYPLQLWQAYVYAIKLISLKVITM